MPRKLTKSQRRTRAAFGLPTAAEADPYTYDLFDKGKPCARYDASRSTNANPQEHSATTPAKRRPAT